MSHDTVQVAVTFQSQSNKRNDNEHGRNKEMDNLGPDVCW